MPEYLAVRPMTLNGQKLVPGDRVPMENLRPQLRRQLIEQRKIEANHADVEAPRRGPGRPRKER